MNAPTVQFSVCTLVLVAPLCAIGVVVLARIEYYALGLLATAFVVFVVGLGVSALLELYGVIRGIRRSTRPDHGNPDLW
jgi:hypothetical protein